MQHKIIILLSNFIIWAAVADPTTCTTYTNGIMAVFEPVSYTCDSGYFLPANTTGCRPCPSGYSCAGGTYSFNETKSQGLVRNEGSLTHVVQNACSSDVSRYMAAVFVPDTEPVININWDNDGDVSTTNCVYGDTISLPTPPARVGYIFTGWKVVNND